VARTYGIKNLYAVDSNSSRLQTAEKHGAKQLNLREDPKNTILAATQNRGADVVIEAVGHGDALRLAYPPQLTVLIADSIFLDLSDSSSQLEFSKILSPFPGQNATERISEYNLVDVLSVVSSTMRLKRCCKCRTN
jgi:Zn-dependent alcohol dehydrogenase